MISSSITEIVIKGSTPFEIFSMDSPEIPEARNRQEPTGGVMTPMVNAKQTVTATWTGDIPNPDITGSRIGAKIRVAGVGSIKVPTISRNTQIIKTQTVGSLEMRSIAAIIF